jgi:hypothetical protein
MEIDRLHGLGWVPEVQVLDPSSVMVVANEDSVGACQVTQMMRLVLAKYG